MFRPSDPQRSLFDARGLLPEENRRRCEATWAEAFRRNALPILRRVEPEFPDLFHPEVGRPNRPVELVLGVLLLKKINDLTDQQALDRARVLVVQDDDKTRELLRRMAEREGCEVSVAGTVAWRWSGWP